MVRAGTQVIGETGVIYNPLTGQPYAGNVIPIGQFNATSKKILDQLIPEANTSGTRAANGQTINNYLINPTLERKPGAAPPWVV